MGLKPSYKIPVAITTSATTAAAADRLPNVESFSFPTARARIDNSNPKDAAADGGRRTVLGMFEGDPSVTLKWDNADSICARIRSAFLNDTSVWFQYSDDNTWGAGTGEKMECKVVGIEKSSSVDGALMATVNFAPNGAPAQI